MVMVVYRRYKLEQVGDGPTPFYTALSGDGPTDGDLPPGNLEESENRRQGQEGMSGVSPFDQLPSTDEA